MSYRALLIRSQAAEQAYIARTTQAVRAWEHLKERAHAAVTPGRVLCSGFLVGLAAGTSEPLKHAEQALRLAQLGLRLTALAQVIEARIVGPHEPAPPAPSSPSS